MTRIEKITDACLVALFLLILFFPLAAKELSLGVQTQEMMARENRTLPEFPSLIGERFRYRDVKSFPERMEEYLTDTLPFRNQIISDLVQRRSGVSGQRSKQGIIGKDGWLYYNPPGEATVDDFLGKNPLSKEDFIRHFTALNERRIHFESRGVEYYFLIAPNKVSVYPEFLPEGMPAAKGDSHREQYMPYYHDYIVEHGIPDFIIDPTDALIAEKSKRKEFLYYPQDTHWNWTARIIAGGVLLDRLRGTFPDIGVIPNLTMHEQPGGTDLMPMMNVSIPPEYIKSFAAPDMDQWNNIGVAKDDDILKNDFTCIMRNAIPGKNVLFIGDSFVFNHLPMPEAFVFNTIVFRRNTENIVSLFEQYGKQEGIDIVVEECVERAFPNVSSRSK